MKTNFPVTFLIILLFLVSAGEALACTCMMFGPVNRELDEARNVVLLKAVSYLDEPRDQGPVKYVSGLKFVVQKVFKGKLKAGQELDVSGGGGCGPSFSTWDLGREFLIFYHSDDTSVAPGCGWTRWTGRSAGELSYLENLDRVRGLTRLSGVVRQRLSTALEGEEDDDPPLEGRTVRITGNGRDIRLKTDEKGLFEVYGLPPGQYRVEPERIKGYSLKKDFFEPAYAFAAPIYHKGHTEMDLTFTIDNEVRGKLVDAEGSPLAGLHLNLVPAVGKARQHFSKTAMSAEDGSFRFYDIPPGKYVIAGNPENKLAADYPYPRFYSNGTGERASAPEITIGPGERLGGFTVKAPRPVETVIIAGRLLFADGNPVGDETVKFLTGDEMERSPTVWEKSPAIVTAYSDKDGKFELKILKGQKGIVYGSMYLNTTTYKGCPERLAAAKATWTKHGPIETPRQPLDASADAAGLEVRFAFSLCK